MSAISLPLFCSIVSPGAVDTSMINAFVTNCPLEREEEGEKEKNRKVASRGRLRAAPLISPFLLSGSNPEEGRGGGLGKGPGRRRWVKGRSRRKKAFVSWKMSPVSAAAALLGFTVTTPPPSSLSSFQRPLLLPFLLRPARGVNN